MQSRVKAVSLPISYCGVEREISGPVDWLKSTLSGFVFSLSSLAGKMVSSDETNCFMALGTKPSLQIVGRGLINDSFQIRSFQKPVGSLMIIRRQYAPAATRGSSPASLWAVLTPGDILLFKAEDWADRLFCFVRLPKQADLG